MSVRLRDEEVRVCECKVERFKGNWYLISLPVRLASSFSFLASIRLSLALQDSSRLEHTHTHTHNQRRGGENWNTPQSSSVPQQQTSSTTLNTPSNLSHTTQPFSRHPTCLTPSNLSYNIKLVLEPNIKPVWQLLLQTHSGFLAS